MQTVPPFPEGDCLVEVWANAFETVLRIEVVDLFQMRASWWSVQQVFRVNPTLPPSGFFDFMVISYAHAMSLGVRRLTDSAKSTDSLVRLLTSMAANHTHLTRERHVGTANWEAADSNFDRFVGTPGHAFVPLERIERDIVSLVNAAAPAKKYADTRIAHMDRKRKDGDEPSFKDLHDGVEEIGRIFSSWYGFLLHSDLTDLVPTPVYDWFAPLRVPWIPEGTGHVPYGIRPDA